MKLWMFKNNVRALMQNKYNEEISQEAMEQHNLRSFCNPVNHSANANANPGFCTAIDFFFTI